MNPRIHSSTSFIFSARASRNYSPEDALRVGKIAVFSFCQQELNYPHSDPDLNDPSIDVAFTHTSPHRLNMVSTDGLWSLKVEYDENSPDNKTPKTWQTEITLRKVGNSAIMDAGFYCMKKTKAAVFSKIPPIIHYVAVKLSCMDSALTIPQLPTTITREDQLNRWLRIISDSQRQLPVVVIGKRGDKERDFDPDFVDPIRLCKKLYPAANVVVMAGEAITEFNKFMGPAWTIYPDTIRVFPTGFTRLMPSANAVLTQKKEITNWKSKYYPFRDGPSGYEDYLVRKIMRETVADAPNRTFPERFDSIRTRILDGARP